MVVIGKQTFKLSINEKHVRTGTFRKFVRWSLWGLYGLKWKITQMNTQITEWTASKPGEQCWHRSRSTINVNQFTSCEYLEFFCWNVQRVAYLLNVTFSHVSQENKYRTTYGRPTIMLTSAPSSCCYHSYRVLMVSLEKWYDVAHIFLLIQPQSIMSTYKNSNLIYWPAVTNWHE